MEKKKEKCVLLLEKVRKDQETEEDFISRINNDETSNITFYDQIHIRKQKKESIKISIFFIQNYSIISVTEPAPTVLPPSRIEN